MAPPSRPSLTILETSQISPSAAAAAPGAAPNSLPFTFFDIFWLYSPPVERLFFYEFSAAAASPSFLPALKSSLSLALQSYFPLAGRLRLSPDPAADNRYEIFCSDGDSVAFTFAECVDGSELDFDELSGGGPRDAAKLRMLVPELELHANAPQALLTIQVTAFPRRGAVVVGITVHHAACDGSTSTRFVNAWAAACRRILSPDAVLSCPPPPLVDRSVISDPRGLYSIFYRDLPTPDQFKFNIDPAAAADNVLLASFKLTRIHIQMIKKWIAARSPRPVNCSTTVAAYAFVWAGHARARRSSGAGCGRRRLHFIFPADFRRRVEPPIPAEYFGNCIGPCFVEADAEELLGGEGLAAAAAAIAKGIEALSSGLEGAENWMTVVKAVGAEQPLSAAGSPRFGVYEADFGWGRPRRVEIASVVNTGAVALAEAPDEEEGGVQIGLALRRQELELFQNYFVQALKDLTE